jgi:hypothetical protein
MAGSCGSPRLGHMAGHRWRSAMQPRESSRIGRPLLPGERNMRLINWEINTGRWLRITAGHVYWNHRASRATIEHFGGRGGSFARTLTATNQGFANREFVNFSWRGSGNLMLCNCWMRVQLLAARDTTHTVSGLVTDTLGTGFPGLIARYWRGKQNTVRTDPDAGSTCLGFA